ncbi:hypothetical protein [Mesorhizobium onobrychidis]|uniref:Uncharacterized protein n=1 Tax=Mesorhizobium onobrychidis TaxID=2775404 RepID=A0ABY5QW65_9HYPH|nr:hypothetical protein [Mesorhizobium onobrychidis]UVC15169.1 hypothetical protein IHQ72_32110 [Mesorhizobium onobrychidis]
MTIFRACSWVEDAKRWMHGDESDIVLIAKIRRPANTVAVWKSTLKSPPSMTCRCSSAAAMAVSIMLVTMRVPAGRKFGGPTSARYCRQRRNFPAIG